MNTSKNIHWTTVETTSPSIDFDRVKNAYDLSLMQGTRLIVAGGGGSAGWLEDVVRAGVSQIVAIDPDYVSATNLATQQTYASGIGQAKVDCIGKRLLDINSSLHYLGLCQSLDDLSDADIGLLLRPIDGITAGRVILCGMTDNFFAQARINALGLHFGIPTLCAQVYHEGRGVEVSFTYPGVTPACHRCILSSRYAYYLQEEKRENPVTSHGTPIFATTRLNALKGYILTAMIHHGSCHPRWGTTLKRIGNRNLIQVRLDPDFGATMGIALFDNAFHDIENAVFFDETLWLAQDPEHPDTGYERPCPDCGGAGNLFSAIGAFADTRVIAR